MYQLFPPAKPLQPFIASYWMFRAEDGQPATLEESIFVDGQADILFNFGCAYTRKRLDTSGMVEELGASNVDAQRDYPVGVSQQGAIDLVAVRFRPGGLGAFSPIPSHEISNQTLKPELVFGRSVIELENCLFDSTENRAEQVRLLDSFFLRRMKFQPPFPFVLYVAGSIEAAQGNVSIGTLSDEVGYSIRTVDRLFRQGYGFSPKFYARVVRFQRVMKLLSSDTNISLTEIAQMCGYYDQSHLNKEFADFAGQPPEQYRAHLKAKTAAPPPNLVQFLQAE